MGSVKVSGDIAASAEAVWGLFRDFGGVKKYTPGVESCTVEGEGVGAVRTIAMPGGFEIQERLEAFDDAGRTLQYAIVGGPMPLQNYLATIAVSETGDGCHVDWSSTFEVPDGMTDEQANGMIEGIYQGGIDGVKKVLAG